MSAHAITRDDLINRFSIYDYIVLIGMLSLSAGIGIFYGCFGKKMQDTKEFLMAGKSMGTFPVAMSLIASFMSAVGLLGTPNEVYTNGMIFYLSMLSYFIVIPVAIYMYLPVFWNLQLTSVNQYLEIRFSKSVRKLGSFILITQLCMYMAIVVYAPSLALAQVTGIHVYVSATTMFMVCIFYTTLGGMKAVLWTDTLQVGIMYATMLFIVCNGFIDGGGFMAVWEVNKRGNRTTFVDWDLNPTTRHTFWGLTLGYFLIWIPIFGVNQAQVQRYLCVRKKYMVIQALWITLLGFVILVSTSVLAGLLVYAKYEKCDPVKSGLVSKGDQLLPLYVMDTLGKWRGVPGFFVAGIFSGSLSTVSTGINSLASITLEDFVRDGCYPNISERGAMILSKVLSVAFGLLSFGLLFIAERMGDIITQVSLSVTGMMGGPLCGAFTLGMFYPWANSLGAFFGTLLGFAITLWIGIGYQISVFNGNLSPTPLPINTYGCANLNLTFEEAVFTVAPEINGENVLSIYRVSYIWYSAIGCISSIALGMLISFITGFRDVRTLNPALLSPLVHWTKHIIPRGNLIGVNYKDDKADTKMKDVSNTYNLGKASVESSRELGEKQTCDQTGEDSSRL